MRRHLRLLLLPLLSLACTPAGGGDASPSVAAIGTGGVSCELSGTCAEGAARVYVLGSSYSWDMQPEFLDGEPSWHIFCAKSLDYIFQNPLGHCLAGSTPWPDVLEPPARPFAYVTFQPVPVDGSTQAQDVSHISHWLADEPLSTVGVIQATWPVQLGWEDALHDPSPDHTYTNYSIDYYYDLLRELERANPGRHFVLTRSNEMLDFIYHDVTSPIAFDALFRDTSGHMSNDYGHYLQHNALRQAVHQDVGVDVSPSGLDVATLDYLDRVIGLFPPE